MFYSIIKFIKSKKPVWKGKLFKLLYQSSSIRIGTNFQCVSFPDLTITQNGKIIIGDNVLFRKNVEIRSHQDSKLIIGNNIRIDRGVRLLSTNKSIINIEEGVRIGLYSVFNGGDSIRIGQNSLISGFVYIQTSMHKYQGNDAIKNQGYDHGPILLEKNVWLGAHVVILPNVTIKSGSIVGSNAVVNKSVEINTIVGGVPAKVLKIK